MAVVVAVVSLAVSIYSATRTVTVPGQKLGDVSRQTAKEGEPRLIVWGTVRPIGGNVVAVQEPPRIERRKQRSGGKGGGGSKTTTEHPRRTYAIGVCEGPITGFRRIWRNNKLVYDGRPGSSWGAVNNGVFLRVARFYYGTFDQLPDPNLEAVFGVGNVPAMRGTAYLVMVDEDLTDTNGAIPQWQFEVVRAEGAMFTSRPYELESTESLTVDGTVSDMGLRNVIRPGYGEGDDAALGGNISRIQLRAVNFEFDGGQESAAIAGNVSSIRLHRARVNYDHPSTDAAEISGDVVRIKLSKVLAPYSHPSPDAAEISGNISRIYLNEP